MKKGILSQLIVSAFLLLLIQTAKAMDNGVDPFNLGKGDWIYVLSDATGKLGGNVPSVTNTASLMNYEKSQGMSYVIVKAGNGSTNFPSSYSPQFTADLVSAAHAAGLKIFGYVRSYGTDIPGEIAVATNALKLNADGFIIDAEIEWESSHLANNTIAASNLCQGIKAVYPSRFLGLSTFMYISSHSSFPYKQFGLFCDAVMPQCYWYDFGITPVACAADLDREWNNWQNSLNDGWVAAIKPIVPSGEACSGVSGADITAFCNAIKNTATPATLGGYKGANWWRADLHTADMWTGIAANSFGINPANPPAITNVGVIQLGMTVATVVWNTDQGGNSTVDYGLSLGYGTSLTNNSDAISHAVPISGLSSGVTYHYRVGTKNPNGVQSFSGDYTFTTTMAVSDIIIDNPSASMTGSWVLSSGSTDRYGADYRYKSQGTGAAYMTYTPTILQTGPYCVYEWHPQGGNRSSAANHLIVFNGGSTNIGVNQQVNGGQWNRIGTFNFQVGTAGYVRIYDNNPDAGQLNMADAIKFAYALLPDAPSLLALDVVSTGEIDLSWTDNATNADNYIVSRATNSAGPYIDIATLSSNATSYNDTNLLTATTYYYSVRAQNSMGDSTSNPQRGATTLPNPPDAPSNLAATAANAFQINLTWADNATNENTYVVSRSQTSGGPYVDVASLPGNTVAYSDTTLVPSTTYYYVVRAENAGGLSANCAEASATTLGPPPLAPSGLIATTVSASQINLAWTDNSSNETSFTVSRATVSGGPYADVVTLPANTVSFSDTGLLSGITYYYVVRANNAGGPSANSPEASAKTVTLPPTAPSGLAAAAASGTQINLSWIDNAYNEDSYIVSRSATSGGPYTDIATLPANTTAYSDSGLAVYTAYYYLVRASNSAGSAASTEASATTLPNPPTITSQPVSQTIAQNAGATFTVAVSGVGPMSYQWTFNGANISGATASAYTRSNAQLADNGAFAVIVSNSGGSVTSANAALTVNVPPSITTQPQSQTLATGSNFTFSVIATGSLPLTYQWQFNGVTISGATAAAYTKTNAQGADIGYYSVVVSNAFGSVTSAAASLSMNSAVLLSDDFESGLSNWGIFSGATNLLVSTAQNHTAGGSQSAYSSNTLGKVYRNISPVLSGHSKITIWMYDSTQTRAYGEVRSYSGGAYNSGSLRQIYDIGKYNSISMTNEVYDATKYQGRVYAGASNGWFNLNAPGVPTRTVGWHKFEIEVLSNGTTINFYVDGVLGRQITGATYYPLDDMSIGSIGSGSTAGDAWFDDFKAEYYDPPTITAQPAGQTVNVGATATLSVTASGILPTYQWSKNGSAISGATGASLVLTNVQGGDAASYAVVVRNGVGAVTSSTAVLGVNIPPSIIAQPVSQTVNQGAGVIFSVAAGGAAPLTYQWTFNGVNIAGATDSALTKNNVQSTDAGNYAVTITNSFGSVTSVAASLTVNVPPAITTQPVGQTVNQGAGVTFTVGASGTAPLSYQWTFNGVNISGATDSALTKNNVQPGDAGAYAVVVSNVAGSATSVAALLGVSVPPSITSQPVSQTVSQGANVTFSVSVSGTAPLSYQWTFNGVNISGATGSAYTKSNVQSSDAGGYAVIITNVAGSVTSATAVLGVNVPPVITTQPASQTVIQGNAVTFAVIASGTAPLSYQWKFNGGNLSGATASAYTRSNVQPGDAGGYSVVITNIAGSATSANATLTVSVPPSIVTQPASQTVAPGANATLSVVASGGAPLSYQWRFNQVNIAGATATSYTVTNLQSGNVGYYSVVVSNPYGAVTSADAALAINDAVLFTEGFESASLTNWTVCVSPATTLTATNAQHNTGSYSAYLANSLNKMYHNVAPVTGHAKVAFWMYDATGGGGTSGQTRFFGEVRSYSGGAYNNGALNQLLAIGRYSIAFGAGTGSLTNEVVNTTNYQGRVTAGANTGWFNLSGAANRAIGWHKFEIERLADGTTVNFYVDGVLGRQITGVSYFPIDDLTIGSLGSGTQANGDAWFDDVKLEYYDPPTISTQPQSQTANAGASVTLSVTAAGGALSYQWRLNATNIAGATASTLSLNDAQQVNAGSYSVVVLNANGPVTSVAATLTVTDVAPAIVTQPVSQTLSQGANASFSVVAAGSEPMSYQWTFNGGNIAGATASAYSRSNVQSSDAGSFAVVVSNALGGVTSANATLTIAVPPSITTQPAGQTVAQGANVSFAVTATGTAPLTYQWKFNGGNIAGATSSAYTKTSVQSTDSGSYSVAITNVAGNVTSANAVLAVNVPPSITTQPVSQTINQSGNATFSVTAAGTAPLSYQWTFNGANISGATASTYTKSNAQGSDAGSYAVVVTNVAGTVTSANAILTVNVPPSITTQPASQSAAQGGNVTFSVVAAGTAPLSYQWKFNGANISGATASAYTKSNAQSTDAGSYMVVVSNMAGSANSANAVLTINVPPSITTQPASQSVAAGANVTFSVSAAGTAPLSYQWRKNGATVSGATLSAYSLTSVQSADAASYSVVITNVAGSVTSANAVLTVNNAPSLSLGASRATETVVNFETMTNLANDAVMFRRPSNSGSTSAFIDTTQTNYTQVATNFPGGNPNGSGSKVLAAGWTFKTGTTNAWLRLNTTSPTFIPNPTFGFTGRIRFDIYANKSILLGMGLRETLSTNLAVGANGGTTGNIEWVGVTNKTSSGSPQPTRSITASNWTTVEFNLPAEPCTAFTGNGVLDGVQGVLEELAIVPNAGLTGYAIYLDNFQMVTTNTLPSTVTMNSGSTLTFTAAGSDPDSGQTLTYSLVSPPSGASINSGTGAFTWTPSAGSSTNMITVKVTDNGVPAQSATQSFTAIVNTDPLGAMSDSASALVAAGESINLTWPAVPGASYQVQYKQGQGEWLNLGVPITVGGSEGSVNILETDQETTYRILDLAAPSAEQ